MKNVLIIILALALIAAAFVTRPSEESFQAFIGTHQQPTAAPPKKLSRAITDAIIKSLESESDGPSDRESANTYEFKDRILWVEVQRDGQHVYTGAFSH